MYDKKQTESNDDDDASLDQSMSTNDQLTSTNSKINQNPHELADSNPTQAVNLALGSVGQFLRDLFLGFLSYFSKILLGTNGLELLTSRLSFIQQSSSVIELVMLLCSQVNGHICFLNKHFNS